MKQRTGHKNYISGLMALAAAGIFAVCVLMVLFAGAESYSSLTERDRMTYESRTCSGFLAARVRQAASPEAAEVVSFGNQDALAFYESSDGEEYVTLIYCYDGWLMEYFAMAGAVNMSADMEFGSRILPAQTMSLQMDGDLLRAEIILEGEAEPMELLLSLRGREEAGYEE